MIMKNNLNGKIAIIHPDNDNENYEAFRGKKLRIIHTAYSTKDHPGYDTSVNGEALCDFEVADTKQPVGFSLYEYEFQLIPNAK